MVEPTPDWVKSRQIDFAAIPANYDHGGVQFMLNDSQIKAGFGAPVQYLRQVARVNSLQAIERMSTLVIGYAPAFQNYQVHHVQVLRDGQVIDKLPNAKVNFNNTTAATGAPEHEGIATVEIYMADIQKGDIIDVAYSTTGQNKAFGNHVIGAIAFFGAEGTQNLFWRLLVPESQKVSFEYPGEQFLPETQVTKQGKDYEWMLENAPKVDFEFGVPTWHAQFPVVSFSDFQSWSDVRQWAINLFQLTPENIVDVKDLAESVIGDRHGEIDRMLALVRFMKEDIRYVGMEIGRNAFKPFTPQIVAERRYGDCKDQAALLTAMLRSIGINAWPALVNTEGRKLLELQGPTPAAFDHAIVYAEAAGRSFWIDPTEPLPDGFSPDLEPPLFEAALVLRSDATSDIALIELPEGSAGFGDIHVDEKFDFSEGLNKPGSWTRVSTYTGVQALQIASQIDAIGKKGFQEQLKKIGEGDFGSVEVVAPLETTVEANRLTISEAYRILDFDGSDSSDLRHFSYRPKAIAQELSWPKVGDERKSPFQLGYPRKRSNTMTFSPPSGVVFDEFKHETVSKYHDFRQTATRDGNTLELTYSYDVLETFVPAANVKDYAEETSKIADELSFVLQWQDDGEEITSVQVMPRNTEATKKGYQLLLSKLEKLMSDPNATELDAKALVTDLVNEPEVPTSLKRYFLESMTREGPNEDRLFALDNLIQIERGKVPQTFTRRADIRERLGRYEKANEDYMQAIDLLARRESMAWPAPLWDRVRVNLWRLQQYEKLADVLKSLIEHSPSNEVYRRELVVTLNLLGQKEQAALAKQDLEKAGYKDLPALPLRADKNYQRIPRAVFQTQPPYPELARQLSIEGFAIVQYTIKDDGTVKDCEVLETSPKGYFDAVACKTASSFVYYPAKHEEAGGDVEGWKIRFKFDLED